MFEKLKKQNNKVYKNKISGLLYEEVIDTQDNLSNWEEVDKTPDMQYSDTFISA